MDASATSQSNGVVNFASGAVTGDGTDITVTVGFVPRFVRLVNIDGVEVYEKMEGMSATQSVKTVTAGTTTIDTSSAIVINTDGTITLDALAVPSGEDAVWVAFA